jgi:hypothetical protein
VPLSNCQILVVDEFKRMVIIPCPVFNTLVIRGREFDRLLQLRVSTTSRSGSGGFVRFARPKATLIAALISIVFVRVLNKYKC